MLDGFTQISSVPLVALLLAAMVVADFFVPMVPSATTIATIAGFLVGEPLLIAGLVAWAAGTSWLGDVIGYRAVRRIRGRMRRPVLRSAAVTRAEIRLRGTLADRPRWTTVVARFVPAGRTALAWAAVAAPDYPHSRMASLAGLAWASYLVGVGLLIGWVFGSGPLSAATTVASVAAVSVVLGWWFKGARPGAPADGTNLAPVRECV